jgi:hypothetical protein
MADRIIKPITTKQLVGILAEVKAHHDWPMQGRKIKYVDFHYNNRTCNIFTITFRGVSLGEDGVTLTCVNRLESEGDINLYAEVMAWLKTGETA